jgi:hypothetical protein
VAAKKQLSITNTVRKKHQGHSEVVAVELEAGEEDMQFSALLVDFFGVIL